MVLAVMLQPMLAVLIGRPHRRTIDDNAPGERQTRNENR